MARSRNLKPSFFQNEDLAACGPLGMLLFEGLWCQADREGRLEDRPVRLKVQILPYFEANCDELLTCLEKQGFISRYRVKDVGYIEVINFKKHQNPHVKEASSIIPAPENTGKAKELPEPSRPLPSSLSLDSLNPEDQDRMSGKPDASPPNDKKHETRKAAKSILSFLNEKAGRNFEDVQANLDPIISRMKEGYTSAQLHQVIAKKCREWLPDEKMRQYLRPATLFNRTKFANYAGELIKQEPKP